MRLLVTGGAGSLGSNLIEHLRDRAERIVVLDNFATGKRTSLPTDSPNLQIVEGDVADAGTVDGVFADLRPTHVVHSAAAYKDPSDWATDANANVLGSINVAKAAERHDVTRLVNFQTALVYGRPDDVPIPVDAPVRPFTSYGISKLAGELFLLSSGLPVTSLRLANVTGPRLAIGPIPTFYKRIKAGEPCKCSTTVRDFLDMSDFLGLMDRVLADSSPTGLFNASTGEGKTISEVYGIVANHLGADEQPADVVPPGADDVPAVVLDPSHTEAAFGWRAQVSAERTIRRLLAWYDEHGITDVYSHLAAPGAAQKVDNS